jgi:hypothetical protein
MIHHNVSGEKDEASWRIFVVHIRSRCGSR